MKRTIFFVPICLILIQCSAPAPAPKQNLNFYLRYLAEEDVFRAEATLLEERPGGAPAPVEMEGGIRYAGKEMHIIRAKGITYFLEQTGGYNARQAFTWKNAAGETASFVVSPVPVTGFGFADNPVDRTRPNVFTFVGEPFGKGEAMAFLWQNLATGASKKFDITTSIPGNRIEFPAAKLSELSAGAWSLYLVRRKLVKADMDKISVSAISEYYSKTDTILLK